MIPCLSAKLYYSLAKRLISQLTKKIAKLIVMIFTCVYSEVEGARPVYLKEPDHDHGIFC